MNDEKQNINIEFVEFQNINPGEFPCDDSQLTEIQQQKQKQLFKLKDLFDFKILREDA